MGKIETPYLVTHEKPRMARSGTLRARRMDRQHGWATVRLHDDRREPIRDLLKAAGLQGRGGDLHRLARGVRVRRARTDRKLVAS